MSTLPSFKSPPVTEVVIGSRFEQAAQYSVLSVGQLGTQLQELGFHTVQEHPGYDAPTERFGPGAKANQVSLELLTGPPPTRYWFLNDSGDELLQLQPDWLAANWRKVTPEAKYGRWDSRWAAFSVWIGRVQAAVSPEKDLEHNQVEVTYVNHIEPSGVWSTHSEAAKVFTFLRQENGGFLGAREQIRSDIQFVMTHEGESVGRLHVTVVPGFRRAPAEPIFMMNLTARGRPLGNGLDGIKHFADLAHEWIVRGFAELTTSAMHRAWGRDDTNHEETDS